MNRDRYDLPLTTVSDRAAALYRDGADRILSAWNGAGDAFDAAIAEDPPSHSLTSRVPASISSTWNLPRHEPAQRGRASWLLPQPGANASTSRSRPPAD
jgi:hypothetical protein